MYPAQSNFTTGGRDGWVIVTRGADRIAVQVHGFAFVSTTQNRLRTIPANTMSFDGPISGSEITPDGKVGQKTMRGLWVKLREMSAPQSMLDAVQRSAATNVLSLEAFRGMAWLYLSSMGFGVPAAAVETAVEVPADTVLPVWGRAAPTNTSAPTFTTISSGPTTPPAPPVDDGTGGPKPDPVDDGSGGGGGGGSKPPLLNPDGTVTLRPRGVPTNDPAPREGTISTGVAVAGVVTVVLLIALAVGARRDAKRASGGGSGGSRSKKRK